MRPCRKQTDTNLLHSYIGSVQLQPELHTRVERVPTEYNIADIPSKPTSGTVQRSIGMALMGRDKIWPDVEPATVTTKNKAIK